jgi:putative transcriptional regulator
MTVKFPKPKHHPEPEQLMAYAAGRETGGKALMLATHLAMCPACRAAVHAAETIGGELLDIEAGIEPDAQPDLDRASAASDAVQSAPSHLRFPQPLRSLISAAEEGAGWRNIWFGVKELALPGYEPQARLLWIPAGRRMPRHDHNGEEFTLVLKGSFSDRTGSYHPGDLQVGVPGLDHQPQAGRQEDCVCLVVEQGGLRLSGWLGRLVGWSSDRTSAKIAA